MRTHQSKNMVTTAGMILKKFFIALLVIKYFFCFARADDTTGLCTGPNLFLVLATILLSFGRGRLTRFKDYRFNSVDLVYSELIVSCQY